MNTISVTFILCVVDLNSRMHRVVFNPLHATSTNLQQLIAVTSLTNARIRYSIGVLAIKYTVRKPTVFYVNKYTAKLRYFELPVLWNDGKWPGCNQCK